jgi:ketosteroid isomerase-like protein
MSSANVELVRKIYDAWARGDYATGYAFDPHVVYLRAQEEGGVGLAGEWRGKEEMRSAMTEFLDSWEDLTVDAEHFHEDGERVLVLNRYRGRGRRSGLEVDHQGGDLFTLRDGRVVRWESYWDRAAAIRAAGLEGNSG